MAKYFSSIQLVAGLATLDIRPPVGQDYEVTDLAASAFVGVAPAAVPDMTAGLFDGVVAVPALFRNSSVANPHIRGWNAPPKWHISRTNWLRLTNSEAGGINMAISVIMTANFGPNGTSRVISDVATVIAGQVTAVRPPVGQDWCITDIGSSRWVGAQPAGLPNVTINLTDGVNAAQIADGANARKWFSPMEIHINNTVWMTLTNPAGAGAVVGWSGFISAEYGPNGTSRVISNVAVLGAGGVGLIQPPVTEEWLITDIGCSVWVGAAPAQLPSILVQYTNGVINAIAQQGTDDKGWQANMRYALTRTVYLSLTDAGAGSNIGWSGYRQPV